MGGCYPETVIAEARRSDMDARHLESAVMAGGSSDGLVARWLAIDHPERTVGLVLWGSPDTPLDNPGALEVESTVSMLMDPVDTGFEHRFAASPLARVSCPGNRFVFGVGNIAKAPESLG